MNPHCGIGAACPHSHIINTNTHGGGREGGRIINKCKNCTNIFTTKLLDAMICVSFQNILSRHSLPERKNGEELNISGPNISSVTSRTCTALRAQSAKLFLQFACQKPSNLDFGVRKVFCFMYVTNENHQGNALFEFALT